MFYRKQTMPEPGDIVLCTVKKVLHNSVFVDLDEYDNKEGIIHISEIAPGRIRTIKEYVKEGKKIICKVLRINEIHGNIELSLRRVTLQMRLKKSEELNLEQKAEKILEYVAQTFKLKPEEFYKKIGLPMIKEYGTVHACFQEVARQGMNVLTTLGIDKDTATKLAEIIKQRTKPQEKKVISKIISMKSNLPNGIDIIKSAFQKAKEHAKVKGIDLSAIYLGSPRFRLTIKSLDYKKANTDMDDIITLLSTEIQKAGGIAETLKEK